MVSPQDLEKFMQASTPTPGRRDIGMVMKYWKKDVEKAKTAQSNFGTWHDVAEAATPAQMKLAQENPKLALFNPERQTLQDITVVDARTHLPGGKDAWKLDEHGFCFITRPAFDFESHKEQNRRRTDREFGPLVCEAVRQAAGAKQVFWMSHQRRSPDGVFAERPTLGGGHSDYGPEFEHQFRTVLEKRYGMPREEAMSCGLLICNMWAPVCNTAYRNPLAYLDGSTVNLETDTIRWLLHSHFDNGYGYQVENNGKVVHGRPLEERVPQAAKDAPALAPVANPKHRWVFLSDMREDEAVIFKQIDFRPSAKTKVAFHAGITDPFHKDRSDLPGRSSIECRLILTFDPETPSPQAKL